jgi:hypothetical protein
MHTSPARLTRGGVSQDGSPCVGRRRQRSGPAAVLPRCGLAPGHPGRAPEPRPLERAPEACARVSGATDFAPAPAPSADSAAPGTSFLYIIQAANATLNVPNARTPERGNLRLTGVDSTSTWFSNKPVRRAGRVMTEALAGPDYYRVNGAPSRRAAPSLHLSAAGLTRGRARAAGIASTWLDSPNAALYSGGADGGRVAVLRLNFLLPPPRDPGTLTFAVSILPQVDGAATGFHNDFPGRYGAPAAAAPLAATNSFPAAALFLDSTMPTEAAPLVTGHNGQVLG